MVSVRSTAQHLIVAALGVSLILVGCAQPRQHYILAASAADTCTPLREPFVAVIERQQEQLREWAAIGAAAGGGIGAAVGARRGLGETLVGLVIGAVAGAMAGASAGYLANLRERSGETAALRNAVFTDAREDAQTGDRLVEGVIRLNDCRMTALAAIAREVRSGTLTREEARARLADTRSFVELDNELITKTSSGLRERTGIYVNALAESGADDPEAYIRTAETYRPRVTTAEPRLAADRPSAAPIGLARRNRSGETPVEAAVKSSVELDALQAAHLQTVDNGIDDIEALLI